MNRDMYFLRVITKDTVAMSFNNMLFLGFIRQRKNNMKHISFQDIT